MDDRDDLVVRSLGAVPTTSTAPIPTQLPVTGGTAGTLVAWLLAGLALLAGGRALRRR